jgi:hypothetical protein
MNVDSQENPKSIVGAWVFTILYCAFSFGMFYFAVTVWREFKGRLRVRAPSPNSPYHAGR